MSDASAHAVRHVAFETAAAVVVLGGEAGPEHPNLRMHHVSAQADVGAVVESVRRPHPGTLTAVLLDAEPRALLRLVPHLPALARTPTVFHVATRGEHAEVLQLRQSGVAMLYSASAAQAQDNAVLAHLLAGATHTGVVHFYDPDESHVHLLGFDELRSVEEAAAAGADADAAPPAPAPAAVLDEASWAAALDGALANAARLLGHPVATHTLHGGSRGGNAMAIALGSGAAALAAAAPVPVLELFIVRPLLPERLLSLVPTSVERLAVLSHDAHRSTKLSPLLVDLASAFQHVQERAQPRVLVSGTLGSIAQHNAAAAAGELSAALEHARSGFTLGDSGAPAPVHRALTKPSAHEEAYSKMLQQVFGDALQVVNVPGADETPEYALGKALAQLERREALRQRATDAVAAREVPAELQRALREWLGAADDAKRAGAAAAAVQEQLQAAPSSATVDALRGAADEFAYKSRWIIGNDAYAYDAGMGGVHHMIAAQRKLNMLVFDTVPYSDRDQVPVHLRKKDIGLYAMNYGHTYVASTAVYADYTQVLHALMEADRFDGPSIVLAYVPQYTREVSALDVLRETKLAVDSGYWPLYRWDPSAEARGGDVFHLDGTRIRQQLKEFLDRQSHFSLLASEEPDLPYDLAASQGTALRAAQRRKAQEAYNNLLGSLEGPPLLVLFASDGGTAEKVAKRLATRGKLRGLGVRVLAMDDYPVDELAEEKNVVFVTSTAGQGEPPQNGRSTFKALARMPTGTFNEETRFAVFGMGDSHYWPRPEDAQYYNRPGRDLDRRLAEIGASRMVPVGLGDDQDADGWQTGYKAWEPTLWKALGVDTVEVTEAEPEPITNEHIKVASNYLRGTILEGLADTSTGAICETDTQLTKFHGTYQQFDRDTVDERKEAGLEPSYGFMIRCRLPGGVITPQQWLQLDRVVDDYGGIKSLKITTRQTLQYHMILKRNLKAAMQGINRAMLDTIAACGDVNRNVMCTPNPSLSEIHEQLYETAKFLSESLIPRMNAYHEIWLDRGTDSSKRMLVGGALQDYEPLYGPYYLPRKFKIAIAVPPRNDVDVYAHDVGLVAVPDSTNSKLLGFNVLVGGGMGVTHSMKATYPRLGSVLGFVTCDKLLDVCREIMLIQRDTGDRKNRKQARLKYTIDKYWGGAEPFRAELERRLGFQLEPARPFEFENNTDHYGWVQDHRGNWHCTLWLENGRVIDEPGHPFRTGLRELAKFHRGTFRLTPNQHIIVSDVAPADKPRVEAHLREYKMDQWNLSGLRTSASACVAFPTCGLAMAESERYIFRLIDKIEPIFLASGLNRDEITLRMTGCPNGCARPWVAEIAFVGKAPNSYLMLLGGGHAGQRLNKIFRDNVGEEEIVQILGVLIPRYAQERLPGERFGDWVIRAGIVAPTTSGAAFYDHVDTEKPLPPPAKLVQSA